jgi:hypothetical protein
METKYDWAGGASEVDVEGGAAMGAMNGAAGFEIRIPR